MTSRHVYFRSRVPFTRALPCIFALASPVHTRAVDPMHNSKFRLNSGVSISSQHNTYKVLEILRYTNFGQIAECRNKKTGKIYALKCMKTKNYSRNSRENEILQYLTNLNLYENNIVKFLNDHFDFKDWFCMEFELLKENLLDFSRRQNRSLKVYEIRAIAKQMLTALRVFKQLGISHADLKPENIMLVNHEKQPFGLKLIDFGAACETEQLPDEYIIQTLGYRAPEVILGLQPDESIDMWSLGCILAELFLNYPLFPTQNEYDNLRIYYDEQRRKMGTGRENRSPVLQTQTKTGTKPTGERKNTPHPKTSKIPSNHVDELLSEE
uniref:Protein kinase domain-containing protein n=1 Tax=Nothobranchius furzeri TaxID=105023 RepID=A0A8C6NNN8_NOTFU